MTSAPRARVEALEQSLMQLLRQRLGTQVAAKRLEDEDDADPDNAVMDAAVQLADALLAEAHHEHYVKRDSLHTLRVLDKLFAFTASDDKAPLRFHFNLTASTVSAALQRHRAAGVRIATDVERKATVSPTAAARAVSPTAWLRKADEETHWLVTPPRVPQRRRGDAESSGAKARQHRYRSDEPPLLVAVREDFTSPHYNGADAFSGRDLFSTDPSSVLEADSSTMAHPSPRRPLMAEQGLHRFRRLSAAIADGEKPWEAEARRRSSAKEQAELRRLRQQYAQQDKLREESLSSSDRRRAAEEEHQFVRWRREQSDLVMLEAFKGHSLKRNGLSAFSDGPYSSPAGTPSPSRAHSSVHRGSSPGESSAAHGADPLSPSSVASRSGAGSPTAGRTFFAKERARRREVERRRKEAEAARMEAEAQRRAAEERQAQLQRAARRIAAWWGRIAWWRRQLRVLTAERQRRRAAGAELHRFAAGMMGRKRVARRGRRWRAALVIQAAFRRHLDWKIMNERRVAVLRCIEEHEQHDRRFLDLILRGVRIFQARQLLLKRRCALKAFNETRLKREENDSIAIIAALEQRLDFIAQKTQQHFAEGWVDDGLSPTERVARREYEAKVAHDIGRRSLLMVIDKAQAEAQRRYLAATRIQACWRGAIGRFEAQRRSTVWCIDTFKTLDEELPLRLALRARVARSAASWTTVMEISAETREAVQA